MVSVSELSENAPVWLAPIEKVSFPLPEFLRNTTVDEDVAAVVTRHHNFDNVPAGNGICCVDSVKAAYEGSKHPLKVKKDWAVDAKFVEALAPLLLPSYAMISEVPPVN
jgi:hypothetical protein